MTANPMATSGLAGCRKAGVTLMFTIQKRQIPPRVERNVTMRKPMNILLAAAVTVAGLATVVAPAHAAAKPAPDAGIAYDAYSFAGFSTAMQPGMGCTEINIPGRRKARSAANTNLSSTITLWSSYV